MPGASDLTICSVVFGEGPLIELNRRLTMSLNPGADLRWRVVRNLPVQDADRSEELEAHFEVLDGVELDLDEVGTRSPRSYHHGLAMNLLAAGLTTRYVLYLDPDCFIVRRDWIAEVLSHMAERRLATFGVPYHPRTPQKTRYIPCGVGMFVDTERFPVSDLDWTPGTADERIERASATGALRRMLQAVLPEDTSRRRLMGGASVDTGLEVYLRHQAGEIPTETVQPVMLPTYLRSAFKHPRERALEVLLPDTYCYLPKRPGYMTDRGFATYGFVDTASMGIEEYVWRDEPFALHLRGGPPSLRSDSGALVDLLEQFAPVAA